MDKYFKAVSVGDGLPKGDGYYKVIFFMGDSREFASSVLYNKDFSFHAEDLDCTGVTHWLKETTLEELIEQKSCEFAEWIDANELTQSISGNWRYNRSKVVATTTTELFKKFTIEKGGKK